MAKDGIEGVLRGGHHVTRIWQRAKRAHGGTPCGDNQGLGSRVKGS